MEPDQLATDRDEDDYDDDDERARRHVNDPPHILLAEDDPDLRALIARALRLDGFQVIETEDGREALDRVSEWGHYRWPYEQLDLVVSDVRMPGVSGTEVAKTLRQAGWNTPVILVTAFADPEFYTQAFELGVAAVFRKPFDIDDLRMAVMHSIAQRAASGETQFAPESEPRFSWGEHEWVPNAPSNRTAKP